MGTIGIASLYLHRKRGPIARHSKTTVAATPKKMTTTAEWAALCMTQSCRRTKSEAIYRPAKRTTTSPQIPCTHSQTTVPWKVSSVPANYEICRIFQAKHAGTPNLTIGIFGKRFNQGIQATECHRRENHPPRHSLCQRALGPVNVIAVRSAADDRRPPGLGVHVRASRTERGMRSRPDVRAGMH